MNIYISVDLEGIGGVVRPTQVKTGASPDYEKTRDWATQEILAVCAGAIDAGASEIWIKDAHDRGTNLHWDAFPANTRLICGRTRPIRFPGLVSGFAALFLVGYHAMAGTENAVLDHTWDEGVRFFLNGREIGEIAFDAAIAGSLGVPCAFVTGDDKTASEAREFLGAVETVIVKEAVTAQGAVCYPQSEVLRLLREGAWSATRRILSGDFRLYIPSPPLHFYVERATADGTIRVGEAPGSDIRQVFREVLGQS